VDWRDFYFAWVGVYWREGLSKGRHKNPRHKEALDTCKISGTILSDGL